MQVALGESGRLKTGMMEAIRGSNLAIPGAHLSIKTGQLEPDKQRIKVSEEDILTNF